MLVPPDSDTWTAEPDDSGYVFDPGISYKITPVIPMSDIDLGSPKDNHQ